MPKCFIAAGMADAPWLKVAGYAMTLGIGLYLIPLALIRTPQLLDLATSPGLAILTGFKTAAGLYLLSGGLAGTRPPAVRLIQGAGGIFLLWLPMTALA